MSEEKNQQNLTSDQQQPVQSSEAEKVVDPRDLVYNGGYSKDPREIVNNPAVTPQMLNEPGDLRDDLRHTEE
jgi:hypothetical protein